MAITEPVLPKRKENVSNSVPTWPSMLEAHSRENPLPPHISDVLQSKSAKMPASSTSVPLADRERSVTELQAGSATLLQIQSESRKISAVQERVNMQSKATVASSTIRAVVNDRHFQQIIKQLAERHNSDRWLIREAVRETKHLDDFLKVLRVTLTEEGNYQDSDIADLIKNCEEVFEDVKDGKASARELSMRLRELAGGADKLAQELQIEIKGARKRQQNTLERLVLGSFGLFLVTAFPAALSLSLIGQTIATNIGAALISRVLAERPDN